jgi:hypothetical protein
VHRLSRTAAWIGLSATLAVVGPLSGEASAAAPHADSAPVAASSGDPLADDVMPGMSPAAGSGMPGVDDTSMPGMDHDSMPGMASAAPVDPGHDAMPGMDDSSMPGMTHSQGDSAAVSRPRALVLGGFVLANGAVMVAAAVVRRRTVGRRRPRRAAPATA